MTKNKIIISTPGYPWLNNIYSTQGYYLIKMFLENNFEIIFVPCSPSFFDNFADYKLKDFSKIMFKNADDTFTPNTYTQPKNLDIFKSIKYTNLEYGENKDMIYVSGFNQIIDKYDVDYIFILSELFNFVPDKYFKCKSLIWFPNQTDPLDKNSRENLKLFDKILCLCPSSINVIKKYFCNDIIVSYSSFIVDFEYISQVKNNLKIKDKIELKKNYKIPEDSLVISIMAINHVQSFRKGFDTSFQIYENLLQRNSNLFLYVYAPTFQLEDFDNNLENIIGFLNIPKDKYHIQKTKNGALEIENIYNMTDIMLFGSKTESSGLGILEAQIRGIPVVTNNFLAMKDYTYYGVICDYEQKTYDGYSKGFICMPSVKKLTDGISYLINNLDKEQIKLKKIQTIERLKFQMSYETIKNQILDEVQSIIKPDKYMFCFIMDKECDETRNSIKEIKHSSYVITSKELLKLKDIRYHYLVILQYKCKINPLFFNLINNLSTGVVLKTRNRDGTIYPNSKDELFQYGRYNNIIAKSTDVNSFINLTEELDFDEFYNEIMLKYIEMHNLSLSEHIIVDNI